MVGVDGSVARVVVTPFEHYCNRPEEVPSQKGNASAPAGNAQIPEGNRHASNQHCSAGLK